MGIADELGINEPDMSGNETQSFKPNIRVQIPADKLQATVMDDMDDLCKFLDGLYAAGHPVVSKLMESPTMEFLRGWTQLFGPNEAKNKKNGGSSSSDQQLNENMMHNLKKKTNKEEKELASSKDFSYRYPQGQERVD